MPNWVIHLAAIAPGASYCVFLALKSADARLYWEYAGRLLGGLYTPGYPEWVQHRVGDYLAIEAATPGVALAPYTGFPSEYPPGALFAFALVRVFVDGPEAFALAWALAMTTLLVAAVLLVARLLPSTHTHALIIGTAFAGWALLTGGFAVERFDALTAFFSTAALFAAARNKLIVSAALIGLGASIKLWPALLLGLVAAWSFDGRWRAWMLRCSGLAGVFSVTFLAPHLGCLALGTSPGDVFAYLHYLSDRPVQIETVVANLYAIGELLDLVDARASFAFGSHNIIGPGSTHVARLSTLVGLLWVALLLRLVWRGGGSVQLLVYVSAAALVGLILSSKVFSGEYLIWLMPFAVYAAGDRRWSVVGGYFCTLLILRLVYRHYPAVLSLEPQGTLLILAKNLSLASIPVFALPIALRSRAAGVGR